MIAIVVVILRNTKKNIKTLFVGDTVKIGVFVEEGNKERVQFYEGIILAKSKSCINFTISVLDKILKSNIKIWKTNF